MENNNNYLNNTLNIFTILNLKDNIKSKKTFNNNAINVKKLWKLAQNPYIHDPDLKSSNRFLHFFNLLLLELVIES